MTRNNEGHDLIIEGGVEGIDGDYTYENGVVTILTSTPLTIYNVDINTATTDRITIPTGVSAQLTLDGVNIETDKGSPIELTPDADGNGAKAHITLAKGSYNTLTSNLIRYPGLRCGKSTSLTIDDDVKNVDENGNEIVPKLGKIPSDTVLENGTKVKTGDSLSKMDSENPGTLVINGGTCAAGLGGSFAEDGGNITINGGIINSTARYGNSSDDHGGAGIGGGQQASGGNIVINGGTVTAQGAYHGAGIGGGYAYGTSSSVTALPDVLSADAWGMSGNISINGGLIYSNGGYHGNAFGDACWAKENAGSSVVPNYKICVTGGTLLAKRGAGKGSDLGGFNTDVVILGGSMKAEVFDSKGKNYAYGSADMDENYKVFMTRIKVVGANKALVDDLDMKISGITYSYGKPSYTDEEGCLYLWLPSESAADKEISVELDVVDKNTGNKIETEDFFITNAGAGDYLKQYVVFAVEKSKIEQSVIKKVYDGKGLNNDVIKNQIARLEIETTLPQGGKLNQSDKLTIQAQRLKDDGETVEDNAEIFDFNADDSIPGGKYQLIITSSQFSNSSEGGFKDAYWGHRAYFKYAEILPADTEMELSFEKADNTDYVNPNEDLTLTATLTPNPCEENGTKIDNTSCAAPTGKVQFYVNGEKYGDPVELQTMDKDTTGKEYNYSLASIKWSKDEQAKYEKDKDITVTVEYVGEDTNYKDGSKDSGTFKLTNPTPIITGITAYTITFKGVPNVEYEIKDADGNVLGTVRTDANGKGIASNLERDTHYTISHTEFGTASGKTLPIDAKDLADRFREESTDEATQTGKTPGVDEKAENSKAKIDIDEDGNYKITLKDDIEDTTVTIPDCGGKITIDLNDHDIKGADATEKTPAGSGLEIKKEDGITSKPGMKIDIIDSTGTGKIEGGDGSEKYPNGANGISAGSGSEKPENVEITPGENTEIVGGNGAPGADGNGGTGGKGMDPFFETDDGGKITDGTDGAPWRDPKPSLEKTAENKTHDGDKTTVEDRIAYTIKVENLKEGSLWKSVAIRDRLPNGLELDTESMYLTKPNGEVIHIDPAAYKEAERMISVYVGDVYGGEKYVFTFEVTVLKEAIGKDIGNEAIAVGSNSTGTNGSGNTGGSGETGGTNGTGGSGTGGWGTGDSGWSDGYTEGGYTPGSPYFPEEDPFDDLEGDYVSETESPVYPWDEEELPDGVLPGNAEPEVDKTVENETHPKGAVQQDDILVYRIDLTNPKEGTLWKNVMIFDYLPEELILDVNSMVLVCPDGSKQKVSASVYDETTRMICVLIKKLWGGETYTLTYKVKVQIEKDATKKEEIVNRVEVTGENPDGTKVEVGKGPSASASVKYPEIKMEEQTDDKVESGVNTGDNTPTVLLLFACSISFIIILIQLKKKVKML